MKFRYYFILLFILVYIMFVYLGVSGIKANASMRKYNPNAIYHLYPHPVHLKGINVNK